MEIALDTLAGAKRLGDPNLVAAAELSLSLARLCASMAEMKTLAGLKQSEVFYDDRDSHLIASQLVDTRGEILELGDD